MIKRILLAGLLTLTPFATALAEGTLFPPGKVCAPIQKANLFHYQKRGEQIVTVKSLQEGWELRVQENKVTGDWSAILVNSVKDLACIVAMGREHKT